MKSGLTKIYFNTLVFAERRIAWQKEMAQILYKFNFNRVKKVTYAQTYLNRACEDEFPIKEHGCR